MEQIFLDRSDLALPKIFLASHCVPVFRDACATWRVFYAPLPLSYSVALYPFSFSVWSFIFEHKDVTIICIKMSLFLENT